jgi:hypothetical protein
VRVPAHLSRVVSPQTVRDTPSTALPPGDRFPKGGGRDTRRPVLTPSPGAQKNA